MIEIKIPGKLYLAGEYAVIEPGTPAIISAVNRFVHLKISSTKNEGMIYSHQFQSHPVKWKRNIHNRLQLEQPVSLDFVLESIRVTEKYAQEAGKTLNYFNLEINSELDSFDGKKLGLGSSAAVTVGVVKAVAEFYHLKLTNLQLFKLAALAHYNVQGNGSLGDVAASAFTGIIAYYSPDRNWLVNQPQQPITKLVNTEWPHLRIERLNVPQNALLVVGWTGAPASTKHLIHEVKKRNHIQYDDFIKQSSKCVDDLIMAIKTDNFNLIKNLINLNRKLLNELGSFSNVQLETPLLKKLIDTIVEFNGAGKISGAGGGDCGIGFLKPGSNKQLIFEKWKQNNILPLKITTFIDEE